MKVVGIKQLKAELSEYIRLAKTGEIVLVAERGQVVAELRPARRRHPFAAAWSSRRWPRPEKSRVVVSNGRPVHSERSIDHGLQTGHCRHEDYKVILENLGAGETVDQMLAAHPRLTREAVAAALAFAAREFRLRWL